MMRTTVLFYTIVLFGPGCQAYTNPFRTLFPKIKSYDTHSVEDVGEPVFVTPYLKDGKAKEAQDATRVTLPEASHIPSHAGFFTVNENFNSNMFFWFFPAAYKASSAPLVLWLQGGPGGSSLFGLFVENGPFSVSPTMELVNRNTAWSLTHNLLYIDNPVGTGFSFTNNSQGFATNQTAVAEDLFNCIIQFYNLFPQLQKNEFYITGESYAGKYVPAISYRIHQNNKNLKRDLEKINFKGMAIGDGLCDPVSQADYGDFLYGIGLVDQKQRDAMKKMQDKAIDFINNEQWMEAFEVFDELLNGDRTGYPSYFANVTGFNYYFNFVNSEKPKEFALYPIYIEKASTRLAIHVGNLTYNDGAEVEKYLITDIMKSVKPWIEGLISAGYRVMIYNGQLDIIIANTLTQNFIDTLNFKNKDKFDAAPRKKWYVGPNLAGYSRTSGNFSQVLVRNAGHMVPYDQPKAAFDLINRFTSGKSIGY